VYETRKSIKTVDDNNTLSQVRKIDGAIRELLNTNNPDISRFGLSAWRATSSPSLCNVTIKSVKG
jgi:negative regulator of sigma E activity